MAGYGDLWGLVLAGGEGKRMGGDKPHRLLGGRSLVDLAVRRLEGVCPQVLVVCADAAEMAHLTCPVAADRWPGQGPLAALVTAFQETPAEGFLVTPVDMPLASRAVLSLLLEGDPTVKARTLMGPRGWTPLLAYYSRACLPHALRLMDQGERRLRFVLEAVKAEIVPWARTSQVDPEGLCFLNVNYPEDLQLAEGLRELRGLCAY